MPRQRPRPHMKTDTTTMARPSQAQEADAAERATSDQAKTENLAMFAGLSDAANDTHIEEHIQGMVAVTMGHLSADAPASAPEPMPSTGRIGRWALRMGLYRRFLPRSDPQTLPVALHGGRFKCLCPRINCALCQLSSGTSHFDFSSTQMKAIRARQCMSTCVTPKARQNSGLRRRYIWPTATVLMLVLFGTCGPWLQQTRI